MIHSTSIQSTDLRQTIDLVLAENQQVLTKVDLNSLTQLSQIIIGGDRHRIFIAGEGCT